MVPLNLQNKAVAENELISVYLDYIDVLPPSSLFSQRSKELLSKNY